MLISWPVQSPFIRASTAGQRTHTCNPVMTTAFLIAIGAEKLVFGMAVARFVADRVHNQRLPAGPGGIQASVPSRFVKFLEGVFGI